MPGRGGPGRCDKRTINPEDQDTPEVGGAKWLGYSVGKISGVGRLGGGAKAGSRRQERGENRSALKNWSKIWGSYARMTG